MARVEIGLPDDPVRRHHHLQGVTSATQNWTEADIKAARPALEPWRSDFEAGRRIGTMLSTRNPARRKALQKGFRGLIHRLLTVRKEKDDKRLELP